MTGAEALIERVLPDIAHLIYADAYARLLEEHGHTFPAQSRIEQIIPRNDEKTVPLLRDMLSHIEDAWGVPLAQVVDAMGLSESAEVQHALGDLVLGCLGHGVTLDDNFSAARERAEGLLERELSAVPIHEEGVEFWNAAYDALNDKSVS